MRHAVSGISAANPVPPGRGSSRNSGGRFKPAGAAESTAPMRAQKAVLAQRMRRAGSSTASPSPIASMALARSVPREGNATGCREAGGSASG